MIGGVELRAGYFEEETVIEAINNGQRRNIEIFNYKRPVLQGKTAIFLIRSAISDIEILGVEAVILSRTIEINPGQFGPVRFGLTEKFKGKTALLVNTLVAIDGMVKDPRVVDGIPIYLDNFARKYKI